MYEIDEEGRREGERGKEGGGEEQRRREGERGKEGEGES